ncbi:hypothetical protein SEA_SKOG_55 [Gordonia phage Skog]|uniref:Uncharacterized protein n=1 Tax=Gordonia phage Skog TaxID=2704033 RepID=A0A6G6XJG5_9CAUD|nr:hypothetical protein KHQ85_gp055 [Gordonia phage Skog]QIG58207.1 hypothetical protein SEA_SKOG_55 [Gordonia phage Skog]
MTAKLPPPLSERHQATLHLLSLFEYKHLPNTFLRGTSAIFHEAAHELVGRLHDGPELSAGLRKLVEAKDCCVRQAVIDFQGKST